MQLKIYLCSKLWYYEKLSNPNSSNWTRRTMNSSNYELVKLWTRRTMNSSNYELVELRTRWTLTWLNQHPPAGMQGSEVGDGRHQPQSPVQQVLSLTSLFVWRVHSCGEFVRRWVRCLTSSDLRSSRIPVNYNSTLKSNRRSKQA